MKKPETKKICQHPEKLKGQPGECSPEQIKECHGEAAEHPCVGKKWFSQQTWLENRTKKGGRLCSS